jgi:hypothetical protein
MEERQGVVESGSSSSIDALVQEALRIPPPRRLLVSCEPVLESSDSKVLRYGFRVFLRWRMRYMTSTMEGMSGGAIVYQEGCWGFMPAMVAWTKTTITGFRGAVT